MQHARQQGQTERLGIVVVIWFERQGNYKLAVSYFTCLVLNDG